jgi:hypothetical protein
MSRTIRNRATTALRVLAGKYLRLARTTADPRERSKFFHYAAVYADLSERSERHRNRR